MLLPGLIFGGITMTSHERHCVWNHPQLNLFRLTTKKTSNVDVTGPLWPVDSPHKGPVMLKEVPCYDVTKKITTRATPTFLMIHFVCLLILINNEALMFNSLAPGRFEYNFIYVIFRTDFNDWWLRHLLWNCPHMIVTGLHWWSVNIGSVNGLVPSGNKPLPEPMLTQISVAIWRH